MRRPAWSLRRTFDSVFMRAFLFGLVVMLVGTGMRIYFLTGRLSAEIEPLALAVQQTYAEQLAQGLGQSLGLRRRYLHELATRVPPALSIRPAPLRAWLAELPGALVLFSGGLYVEDADGRVLARYPATAPAFVAAGGAADAGLVLGRVGAEPVVSIGVVLAPPGQPRAILRGVTPLGAPGLLDHSTSYRNGLHGGYYLVFSREQQFATVASTPPQLSVLPAKGVAGLLAGASAAGQGVQAWYGADQAGKEPALAGTATVPGAAWQVVAYVPRHEALAPVLRIKETLVDKLSTNIPVLFVLVCTGVYLVVRPLKRAARHADRMTRGEVPLEPLHIVFQDEVGDLMLAFNRLLHKLTAQSGELTVQKELAESATQAKSRFLAAASHDLRQPMHALNLYLGALSRFDLPPAAQPVLASVRHCAQTMDEMFRALLDISRLDASVMRADYSHFPIAAVLDKIRVEFAQQASEKGLRLRVAACALAVRSDVELLERIVRNLVSNALRYTASGTVLVGCRRIGGVLRLAVYDTGAGIDAQDQGAVFEEFYQVGNPERDRVQGLGLGLAIVERLARLLEAPLALRSQVGRGSVFSIDLPLALADCGAGLPAPLDAPPDDADRGTPLIAVIDDEVLIRDATGMLLAQAGYHVVVAASGAEILGLLGASARVPDAIVCDYRLRDNETGFDVVNALREEFNSDIPALLITGDTSPERIKQVLATGLPILHKPLQDHVLLAALARLLRQRGA